MAPVTPRRSPRGHVATDVERKHQVAKSKTDDASENGKKAMIYCILLALQFGLQPMLFKKFSDPLASKNSLIIGTEMTKIIITAFTLAKEGPEARQKIASTWTFLNYLQVAALPAALYAMQNLLMLFGCDWLDAMTVNLLNQTKTLSAALFLYLIMGQRQSPMQLFALFLMLLSAVILTSRSDGMNPFSAFNLSSVGSFSIWSLLANPTENTAVLGMLAIGAASMISGLSTALTQNALSKGRHPIFLSAELASFGIFSLIVTDMFQHNGQSTLLTLQGGGPFKHWTWWTLIPVLSSAVGGIIVGLVTKYAGGVTKGFALIAGIIVTGVVEFVVDGTPLGPKHVFAAGLVSISIWIHSSFKYVAPSIKEKKN